MTIAGGRSLSVAAGAALLLLGGVGRTLHAGQMTPASVSQIQQPGQQTQTPQQQIQNPMSKTMPNAAEDGKDDDTTMSARARQVKMREDDRQKRLVSDTEKLLILATQLHNDVAKTNKDILSLDVIKRADEIEKLAHNVKLGMKE